MRIKQKRIKTLKGRNSLLKAYIYAKKSFPHWFDERFTRYNGEHTFTKWLNMYVYLNGSAKGLI